MHTRMQWQTLFCRNRVTNHWNGHLYDIDCNITGTDVVKASPRSQPVAILVAIRVSASVCRELEKGLRPLFVFWYIEHHKICGFVIHSIMPVFIVSVYTQGMLIQAYVLVAEFASANGQAWILSCHFANDLIANKSAGEGCEILLSEAFASII